MTAPLANYTRGVEEGGRALSEEALPPKTPTGISRIDIPLSFEENTLKRGRTGSCQGERKRGPNKISAERGGRPGGRDDREGAGAAAAALEVALPPFC